MQMHTLGGPYSLASGFAVLLPPLTTPKAFRAALGDEIERMIDLLDRLDGDTDLEVENEHGDGNPDDEPSLGGLNGTQPYSSTPSHSVRQTVWAGGGSRDAELDTSDYEDGHDRKASDLAGDTNGNLECDGNVDKEPSLGSLNIIDQDRWAITSTSRSHGAFWTAS